MEHFFLDLHGLSWDKRAPLLLRYNPDPNFGPKRLAHLTAKEYVDCGYISSEDFRNYFKFSFVRNPWARLVSEYLYRGYGKKYSFKEFVTYWLPAKNNYSDAYRHIMPQYDFLYDANGALLVDFVGRFENLQSDFEVVCTKLRIATSSLPHQNASNKNKGIISKIKSLILKNNSSPKMHYTSYYDTELMKIVGDIYSKDINTFNYKFQQ